MHGWEKAALNTISSKTGTIIALWLLLGSSLFCRCQSSKVGRLVEYTTLLVEYTCLGLGPWHEVAKIHWARIKAELHNVAKCSNLHHHTFGFCFRMWCLDFVMSPALRSLLWLPAARHAFSIVPGRLALHCSAPKNWSASVVRCPVLAAAALRLLQVHASKQHASDLTVKVGPTLVGGVWMRCYLKVIIWQAQSSPRHQLVWFQDRVLISPDVVQYFWRSQNSQKNLDEIRKKILKVKLDLIKKHVEHQNILNFNVEFQIVKG